MENATACDAEASKERGRYARHRYRAGVLGTLYAGRRTGAGHEVQIVACGTRAGQIRRDGLELEDVLTGQRWTQRVAGLDSPAASDPACDLVLVLVRREQLGDLSEPLAAMSAPTVLVMTNLGARTLVASLGPRLLLGFPGAGGSFDGSLVRYLLVRRQPTTVGEPEEAMSARLADVDLLFSGAGFRVAQTGHIDAWLHTHAAFITPLEAGVLRAGGHPAALANSRKDLDLAVRATQEGFAALQALGFPIVPNALRALYALPRQMAVRYWRRPLRGPLGRISLGPQANSGTVELAVLAAELLETARNTGTLHLASAELFGPLTGK